MASDTGDVILCIDFDDVSLVNTVWTVFSMLTWAWVLIIFLIQGSNIDRRQLILPRGKLMKCILEAVWHFKCKCKKYSLGEIYKRDFIKTGLSWNKAEESFGHPGYLNTSLCLTASVFSVRPYNNWIICSPCRLLSGIQGRCTNEIW